ncbi:Sir2 family NAD-dependent protein deacetylase [Candidatus Marimicrobium litorale]|nr:Sir2 family NAD-dependent protein deacetylase [Candidatus Marimicrobium litorale]
MRPDIVWFGEIPCSMNDISRRLIQCNLFVSIGPSGVVYPAARLVRKA